MNKSLAFILLLPALFAGCSRTPDIKNLDSRGSNIICLGDSLTEGVGAEPGRDYPSVLSGYLGRKVINAGVSGDTAGDALKRIKKNVLEQDPQMVIVILGGNDFLQKLPEEETFRNLEKIVDLIQSGGAAVTLAEVKTGLLKDPYLSGFKRLARQKKTLLIPNILKGIIGNPGLMSDTIHPNARGYAVMAKRIYEEIKPYLK
ncbi:MAG: GDSL-type esterase/lipase family protein [Candidatus Omnitrophota bacterium]